MKSRQLLFLLYAFVALIINSCAPAYVPNVLNAPMLTNKNEVQAAVYIGTSGFDPQIAWAPTNHIGVMANASFMNSTSDSTENYHKHSFFEFGAGYYTAFGERFKFETFGGAGFGKISALYENDLWTSTSQVDIVRYFVQPTVGVTSKAIDFGVSSRLALVNMKQEDKSTTSLMLEPAATLKIGWDYIKIVGKVGFSAPLTKDVKFEYQPFLFSVGLQGNFGKVFR
ncbi:MAG: hypothetical protein KA114_08885 [Bacteroidales bacterium]|nr:hypothetical protein [Bacteroidales bacterium]